MKNKVSIKYYGKTNNTRTVIYEYDNPRTENSFESKIKVKY